MGKVSLKQVIESDNWIITKVKQGCDKQIRVDAKTRFYRAGEQNRFSAWYSLSYANRLYRENYGKNIAITEY